MILYRPVGMYELRLIFESKMCAFPPRLPEQPIFYPVTNRAYAEQIAHDWNATTPPFAGYVTQFDIADDYIAQFEKHIVGRRQHEEFWIPAEKLDEFNTFIHPPICVVSAFFGSEFQGFRPTQFGFGDRNAVEQLAILSANLEYSRMDFALEIAANHLAVFLNYAFWLTGQFIEHGIPKERQAIVLEAIQSAWQERWPELPLPISQS